MIYEDTIRVADLKTRSERFARVRGEVGVSRTQVLHVTEYMHPRLEEIADTLPASVGAWLLSSRLSSTLRGAFARGRHVRTTSLGWFLMLGLLASLRRFRAGTVPHQTKERENARRATVTLPLARGGVHRCPHRRPRYQRLR